MVSYMNATCVYFSLVCQMKLWNPFNWLHGSSQSSVPQFDPVIIYYWMDGGMELKIDIFRH